MPEDRDREGFAKGILIGAGCLPVAELLQRLLNKPLAWAGRKTGMNSSGIAELLMETVSVVPANAMMKNMDAREKVVLLLAAKLSGGIAGAAKNTGDREMLFRFWEEKQDGGLL